VTHEPTNQSIVPVPRMTNTGTTTAQATATWFLAEAGAHRLDPIVTAEPEFDDVRLTVSPADRSVWQTWCNLICADPAGATCSEGCITARGAWFGTSVILVGLNADAWGGAQ
jgi:hypothetical protein